MNLLFIATEAAPYYRTGGLSDIVYGLAKELCVQGHDARIVVPRYRTYAQVPTPFERLASVEVNLGSYSRRADVLKCQTIPITYFIDQEFYFGRDDLYGYADDYERFIFLCRAALDMLKTPDFEAAEQRWFPHIVQGFDWATGLIPGWLPEYRQADHRFDAMRFVLFVHNIRRLGKYPHRALLLGNQDLRGVYPEIDENPEKINFLGRGALFADQLVVANPDFNTIDNPLPVPARVLRPILDRRREEQTLHGIVSRIDPTQWDPSSDRELVRPFSDASIDTRVENKLALQSILRFERDPRVPLLGVVSRLIPENGFELLKALEKHRSEFGEIQLAIIAERGDLEYQESVALWEERQDSQHPWVKSRLLFDDNLARRVYAGCDIFLLPAKEHPGGITQLVAMRYGALPVARLTGTISKTVMGYEADATIWRNVPAGVGVGFTFRDFSEASFLDALTAALETYRNDQATWRRMQVHNMRAAFNWAIPVAQYLDVYAQALAVPAHEITVGSRQTLSKESRQGHAFHELANLPCTGRISDTLSAAAGLVRWVLSCDGVYVSAVERSDQLTAEDEGFRNTARLGWSLDLTRTSQTPESGKVTSMLNQSNTNIWRHLGDIDADGICRPIRNLDRSQVSAERGWRFGWSAPVIVQGRLLGWIDALFTSQPSDDVRELSSLTLLASALGLRMETIQTMSGAETISQMGLDFVTTQSAPEAVELACRWAEKLVPGSHAWVFQVHAGELVTLATNETSALTILAQRALESKQPSYTPDWNDAPRDSEGQRKYRSVLTVPIGGGVADATVHAVLIVASPRRRAFMRDDENLLVHHLAPNLAAGIEKARRAETADMSRVQQIRRLVGSLVAGVEFDELLQRAVETAGDVLGARAGALYLLNEQTNLLELRAASGYQSALLNKPFAYGPGEGLTGWIAEHGKPVKFDTLAELHAHPAWSGAYNRKYAVPEPNAFLGIPLTIVDSDRTTKVIGVLKLEDRKESKQRSFFDEFDVHLAEMSANVIATVVYNAQRGDRRLREFNDNIGRLSDVLAGSHNRDTLMRNIVDKILEVLHVDAASLYLADESGTELVIQAAAGYQAPLVERKVKYKWGQGVTGTVAAKREPVVAQSLQELRQIGGGAKSGTYDNYHDGRLQPQSFYGLPLVVSEKPQAIGVLKVESTKQRFFSIEDRLLIGMMANVIATVVYNAQQSERRLNEFSVSLAGLSSVLAGGGDMSTLMDNIVEKILEVLCVDAASLYLADEGGMELTIQAAAGYQKPLVERKVKYKWGQGVTGTIAANRKPVVAQSLEELRKIGGAQCGTFDQFHTDKLQPQSFYGLPLVVSQQQQAMGVLKVESTKQRFFSSEDRLLIEVMANVIATVIYNARRSDKHLGSVLQHLGSLSAPRNAVAELLAHFARSSDSGVTAQLASAVAAILDRKPDQIMAEARALLEVSANPSLYAQVASRATQELVRWHFCLYDSIVETHTNVHGWDELMRVAAPWIELYGSSTDSEAFGEKSRAVAGMLANAVRVKLEYDAVDPSETWYGRVIATEKMFGDENRGIPLLFQRHGDLDDDNQVRLLAFLRDELKRAYPIAVLVVWNQQVPPEQIQRMRQQMSIHAVDIVVATTTDVLQIQKSPSPSDAFRKLVIRQATTQSPFIVDGPVPDAMFFGRDREIQDIIQYVGSGRSSVLIGGRRSGKTSILWRLHKKRLPAAGFRSVFFAVGAVRSADEFFDRVAGIDAGDLDPGHATTIGDLLVSQPPGKPVVVLLDEADKLVEVDRKNGWLISSRLRAAASSGLRIVLSGERTMQDALQDPSSPLLNFGSMMVLGPLEYSDVKKLITEPFGQLEVELEDVDEIVRQIYQFTSGHPNIVQRIGRRLVRVIRPRKVRRVTLDDLCEVINDPTFQREDFLNVYWEWATPLEKLVSLLMAENNTVRRLQDVMAALVERCGLTIGASEVDEALRRLVELRQILRLTPTGYEFAVKAFPRVIAGTIASQDLLLVLADRYRIEKGGTGLASL